MGGRLFRYDGQLARARCRHLATGSEEASSPTHSTSGPGTPVQTVPAHERRRQPEPQPTLQPRAAASPGKLVSSAWPNHHALPRRRGKPEAAAQGRRNFKEANEDNEEGRAWFCSFVLFVTF